MKDRWDKVSQSLVTSHSIIRRKGSAYMRGMRSFGSVLTCSGWGFSHIGRFLSAQDDDTGGAGSLTGWRLRRLFLLGYARKWYSSHGLPVITTIRVGPWRRTAPKAQDRVPRRGTILRSGMKNYMRRSVFLACHEGRSGGIFLADR